MRNLWKAPIFDSLIELTFAAVAAVFLVQLTVVFGLLVYFFITGKSIGG